MGSTKRNGVIHTAVGTLLLGIAISALGGGMYGLSGAPGIPVSWLEGSPFHDYFIPSLILILVVGGSALFPAILVLRRLPRARTAAFCSCALIIGWIAIQVAIIGFVSWLQPAVVLTAFLLLLLVSKLPKTCNLDTCSSGSP